MLRSGTPYVLRLCNNGAAGIFISPNKNGCRYSTEARGNPSAYPEMSPSVLLTAVRNCFPCAPSAKNNIVNSEASEMKPASEVFLSLGNTLYEPALFLLLSQVRDIYRKERSRLCPRTVFVHAAKLHLLSSGLLLGFPNSRERITHWLWYGFRIACECCRLLAVVLTVLSYSTPK